MAEEDRLRRGLDRVERCSMAGMAEIEQHAHALNLRHQATAVWGEATVVGVRAAAARGILIIERDEGLSNSELIE